MQSSRPVRRSRCCVPGRYPFDPADATFAMRFGLTLERGGHGGSATHAATGKTVLAGAPSPPHINSQKLIWQTLEENPGLPSYDIFVSPQLVLTKNGSILCFVGARKCAPGLMGCEDNTGQHDVLVKRSDTGGASWGHAVRVHTESTATKSVVIGNPASSTSARAGFTCSCAATTRRFSCRTATQTGQHGHPCEMSRR